MTYRIGIIGFGGHAQKTVLPAIRLFKDLELTKILTRNLTLKFENCNPSSHNLLTDDFNHFLENVDIVYISNPISEHFHYCKESLINGKHIICEKVLTHDVEYTKSLINLSKNKAFLFEVDAYQYHEQYYALKRELNIAFKDQKLLSINTRFSIPKLDKRDIRYQKGLHGGALLDLGFYPISILCDLCGPPIDYSFQTYVDKKKDIDLHGGAFFHYESFSTYASWGIDSIYSNFIEIFLSNSYIKTERIFAKPGNLTTNIKISKQIGYSSEDSELKIDPENQFVKMLNVFMTSIKNNDTSFLLSHQDKILSRGSILSNIYSKIVNG